MKKLMLAVAICCSAIMANAAACSWSVTNVQAPAGGNGEVGWLVEIYSSDVTYDYASAKAGTISEMFSSTTVAQGTTGAVRVAGTKQGSFDAETSGSLYAVIYDAATVDAASHYIVSDSVAYTVNALGKDFSVAFGSMTGTTAAANKFLSSSWQSVPEPTSGLLMLLGVAGLALRRKRA